MKLWCDRDASHLWHMASRLAVIHALVRGLLSVDKSFLLIVNCNRYTMHLSPSWVLRPRSFVSRCFDCCTSNSHHFLFICICPQLLGGAYWFGPVRGLWSVARGAYVQELLETAAWNLIDGICMKNKGTRIFFFFSVGLVVAELWRFINVFSTFPL